MMTREEARKFSYENGNGDDSTVDEIYDDFESRTCENCEYYKIDKTFGSKTHYDCTANTPYQTIVSLLSYIIFLSIKNLVKFLINFHNYLIRSWI